jgi:hypothetical protein
MLPCYPAITWVHRKQKKAKGAFPVMPRRAINQDNGCPLCTKTARIVDLTIFPTRQKAKSPLFLRMHSLVFVIAASHASSHGPMLGSQSFFSLPSFLLSGFPSFLRMHSLVFVIAASHARSHGPILGSQSQVFFCRFHSFLATRSLVYVI